MKQFFLIGALGVLLSQSSFAQFKINGQIGTRFESWYYEEEEIVTSAEDISYSVSSPAAEYNIEPAFVKIVELNMKNANKWYADFLISSDEFSSRLRNIFAQVGVENFSFRIESAHFEGDINLNSGAEYLAMQTDQEFTLDYTKIALFYGRKDGGKIGIAYIDRQVPAGLAIYDNNTVSDLPSRGYFDTEFKTKVYGVFVEYDQLAHAMLDPNTALNYDSQNETAYGVGFEGSAIFGVMSDEVSDQAIEDIEEHYDRPVEVQYSSSQAAGMSLSMRLMAYGATNVADNLRLGLSAGFEAGADLYPYIIEGEEPLDGSYSEIKVQLAHGLPAVVHYGPVIKLAIAFN